MLCGIQLGIVCHLDVVYSMGIRDKLTSKARRKRRVDFERHCSKGMRKEALESSKRSESAISWLPNLASVHIEPCT